MEAGLRQQLDQVNMLLTASPGNPELMTMRDQLMEAIKLAAEVAAPTPPSAAAPPPPSEPTTTVPAAAPAVPAAAAPIPPSVPAATATATAATTATPAAVSAGAGAGAGAAKPLLGVAPDGEISVGSRVEAAYDTAGKKAWYPGVVDSVADDKFVVKFFGDGSTDTLPLVQLRALEPIPKVMAPSLISPGLKVQVRYAADGGIYAAQVEQKAETGWKVKYLAYGQQEVVPPEYIRAMPVKAVAKSLKDIPDTLVIPDHLKVHDTDTEAERKRKRKSVRALKSKHRFQMMDKAQEQKKTTWQSFQTKADKKKKKKGKRTGGTLKRESIFKTPDAPDGKVGVVGSGQGMTAQPSVVGQKHKRLKQG